jgi:predicted P-loop ATPase
MRAADLAGFAKQYRRAIARVPPQPEVALPTAPARSHAALSLDPDDPGAMDADNPELGGVTHSETWQRFGLELVKGLPYPNLDNMVRILSHHPEHATALWYDEFRDTVMLGDAPYDHERDAGPLAVWCQRVLHIHRITAPLVSDAVGVYARTRGRHPLREEIDALQWDGQQRLERAIPDGWGAEASDYHAAVGRVFFLSLMARLYQPGCICRLMPVFEGEQEAGKSTALSIIGGKWYTELTESMDSKDFLQALAGFWLIEIGELESLSKSSMERVKATVSRRIDNYRKPYARTPTSNPRGCVFAGTTNSYQWLADESGATRFLPIRCGRVDMEWVAGNRLQLLAEARERYRRGEDWYKLPGEAARAQQEARYVADPWEEAIRAFLAIRPSVTVSDCYSVLDIPTGERDIRHSRRVGAVLRHLGYLPKSVRQGDTIIKVFERKQAPQPAPIEREPGSDDDA